LKIFQVDLDLELSLSSKEKKRVGGVRSGRGTQMGCGGDFLCKRGEKDKGRSANNKVVTREYTISIHKHIHGVGFEKHTPWALIAIRKFATKEMGIPDMLIDARLSKADEDSPNKLYTLVTYVSVTTSKNLHSVSVDEN
ncbi:hypothetical protein E2I00_013020, partial [Balaenoptera physalus]